MSLSASTLYDLLYSRNQELAEEGFTGDYLAEWDTIISDYINENLVMTFTWLGTHTVTGATDTTTTGEFDHSDFTCNLSIYSYQYTDSSSSNRMILSKWYSSWTSSLVYPTPDSSWSLTYSSYMDPTTGITVYSTSNPTSYEDNLEVFTSSIIESTLSCTQISITGTHNSSYAGSGVITFS